MRRLRQWLIRLTTSMTRRQDETRLREEIDDHVAFETDANLRRGLPPAEARRRALLEFGSMETFKENYRDQQGVPAIEHLLQDMRIALRRMWKTPGFTAAAIATLALGLGLTSAVMSLGYALFQRPLPVDDAARVVFVEQTRVDRPGGWGVSYPDHLYLREHARAFAELAAHYYSTSPMSVVTPGGPVSVTGGRGHRELLHAVAPGAQSGSLLFGRRGSRARTGPRRDPQPRFLADTIRRRSGRGWHDRAHQRHGLHRDRDRARAFPRHRGRLGAERRLDPNGDVRRRLSLLRRAVARPAQWSAWSAGWPGTRRMTRRKPKWRG